MRRSGGTRQIDDVDRRLCELLGGDPKLSNRALATAMGITDETVAARLRRLRDQGVLATTIIVDWEAAGYGVQAMVRVRVVGRQAHEALSALVGDQRTLAATETTGTCDGVVSVLALDLADLHDYVTTVVAAQAGVVEATVEVFAGDLKVPPNILTLPVPAWDPTDLPAPCVPLDDVDLLLLRELTSDGHESNSEVARRLGVSDATVRRRIQRLEQAGLVEIVAAVDPVATGDLTAVAFAFCRTSGPVAKLARALRTKAPVVAAFSALGPSSAVLLLAAPNEGELSEFAARELRRLPGLVAVDLAMANEVLHHRSHLARVHRHDEPEPARRRR